RARAGWTSRDSRVRDAGHARPGRALSLVPAIGAAPNRPCRLAPHRRVRLSARVDRRVCRARAICETSSTGRICGRSGRPDDAGQRHSLYGEARGLRDRGLVDCGWLVLTIFYAPVAPWSPGPVVPAGILL